MNAITSEIIEIRNRSGKAIVAYIDFSDKSNRHYIVIPPAFGETKRDGLKLSYYLVKNGFTVLRYDATNHVGESYGEMVDANFSCMKEDLLSVIDYLQQRLSANSVAIAGTSLGIRVALKAAAEDRRIAFIFGLVPIVDLQSSLRAVYHQDVIALIKSGDYRGKTIDDVMGFEVSVNFARSAIADGFADLGSTRADIDAIEAPVVLMNAENDPWINASDVRQLIETAPNRNKKFMLIPGAMHQLNENPQAVMFALKQAVIECQKHLLQQDISPEQVLDPDPKELSAQWMVEEDRLKILLKKSLEGEKEFWEKYLNKFVLIHKSPDYREFLAALSHFLSIQPGDKVLDAGCGNGHLGAWIFERTIEKIFKEKLKLQDFKPIEYTGIDFAEHSLKDAMRKHLNLYRRVYRELSLRDKFPVIKFHYLLADLQRPLPFEDGYFDKICCNLVLSYVEDPLFSLKELMRVLRPEGRIIVSSMKPSADLSAVYRNFVDQTDSQEEVEEARKLLSAAGRIKQKEDAGIYTFFSEEQLADLFKQSNIRMVTLERAFSNQSNVIVGVK